MVHLFASVHSGYSSAITVLARYGSAARGDPLDEAMVQVGKLLRTVFLCHYFVNEAFRCELLRVLNRGEAVNALKRSIYVGRVASYQAKHASRRRCLKPVGEPGDGLEQDENAVRAGPLECASLPRRATGIDRAYGPTRTEGINLRGVLTVPIEQYQAPLLSSPPAAKSRAFGG